MNFELEQLLEKATDAKQLADDWGAIQAFCAYVSRDDDPNGAAGAIQMILDKVRSPNIAVAGHGLSVLEACVKSCGPTVHAVVGKFRFLNELIKMVSPKYHSTTSDEIKARILALVTQWNFSLPNCGKIREVYTMLRKQGVKFPEEMEPVATQVSAGAGFLEVSPNVGDRRSPLEENDARKSKLLAKLLKSKDPNDLVKANRLIKKMVQEDQKKSERHVQLLGDLDAVKTNAQVLTDLLNNHNPATEGRLESHDLIQEMYKACQEMRPKLFKLASDLGEKDELLGEVLASNDDLTRVLDLYQAKLSAQGPPPAGYVPPAQSAPAPAPAAAVAAPANPLADLMGGPTPAAAAAPAAPAGGMDSLIDLDFSGPATSSSAAPTLEQQFGGLDLLGGPSPAAPTASAAPAGSNPLNDLLGLGLSGGAPAATPAAAPAATLGLGAAFGAPPAAVGVGAPPDLGSLNVSLETIQPGTTPPVTAYDANGLRAMFHFAANSPHPSILVVVISFLNFLPTAITGLQFQAAVPKQLQVKLQPPSGNTLQPNNPIQGPVAVTQVMLISNPDKLAVRLKFKMSYTANGQAVNEMGECFSFPSV